MTKPKGRRSSQPVPLPHPWRRWWPLGVVMIFAGLLYLGTLRAGFIWDDHNLVEMNAAQGSAADFRRLWVSDFWQTDRTGNRSEYYRPLTTSSFLLDRLIYGVSPRGYHLTNLILYAGLCGLAYLLFRRLLHRPGLALGLALAFAALPAHTENAAWISGRTDLISAGLMFASLLVYLQADQTNRPRLWALSVALFFLSLFGKEMSITLVAIVLLHQGWFHGWKRPALIRALPYFLAAAGFALIHAWAAPHLPAENIYTTPWAYLLNVLRNLGLGLWYSLVPGGFDYLVTATREQAGQTFPLPAGLRLAGVILLVAGAAAGVAVAAWKKERLIAFALASGLLALLPISGIVPIGVIFALRFLLIPSFFLLLCAGAVLEKIPLSTWRIGRTAINPAAILLGPIIVLYAGFTLVRVPAWRDDASLMRSALEKAPSAALAHFLLGNALAEQGRETEAFQHFELALRARPEYPMAEYNLGVMEQRRGRSGEAEKRYRSVLAQDPKFRPARIALYRLLQSAGREAEASQILRAE